jgi:hypothetical protein
MGIEKPCQMNFALMGEMLRVAGPEWRTSGWQPRKRYRLTTRHSKYLPNYYLESNPTQVLGRLLNDFVHLIVQDFFGQLVSVGD